MTEAPPARRRIVDTAAALFYTDGVHTVGVNRIIASAGVAKATFYNHFPSKESLVTAYVEEQSEQQRDAAKQSRRNRGSAARAVMDYFGYLCTAGSSPAYRGCPVANVAVEYPDATHRVRRAVGEHRRWFYEFFRGLLEEAGAPSPQRGAAELMLLRDGLLVALEFDDANELRRAVKDLLERVLPSGASARPRRRRHAGGQS